jgi:BirA family biotin operon repressor/biotin-[acetyl-CoA-carboxylase] ligase
LSGRLGAPRLHLARTDSTNERAKAIAKDAPHGLLITASEQTAGHGRQGRTWTAPPGEALLMSLVLHRWSELLPLAAAVAVAETAGEGARIKWPNDVLVQGRKVCGILIEQSLEAGGKGGTVAGLGLNVNQGADAFAAAGLPEAGSLAVFTGETHDTDDMARRLLAQLDEEYDRLCRGDLATLEACWKRRVGLLGKVVVAQCPDGAHRGRLLEMGWQGLELEQPDGGLLCLQPEAVRHLRAE